MYGNSTYAEFSYSQFNQFDPLTSGNRASAFNFCNPFDHILPPVDGDIENLDRQHLWGLYTGIEVGTGAPPAVEPNPNQIEPVAGGTGGTWPTRRDYKKKRQAILDDEQDFLDLIELAMPEIIKYLRR